MDATRQAGGWRLWLLPALLLLLLLAPLLRWGIPATSAGLLPLYPDLARVGFPPVAGWIVVGGEFGYKLLLGLSLLGGAASVAGLAHAWWGAASAWWMTALWLSLPLTISLLYQRGWPHLLLGVALLALGGALLATRARWLGALPALAGAALLWQVQPALVPYPLLSSAWPDPTPLREWVGAPSFQLGVVPLVLATIAAGVAWPQRARPEARRVLRLLALALAAAALTLVGGPLLLYLAIATLALLLAAAGLPALDERYASPVSQIALLAVAALAVYPALQPAWLDEVPAQPGIGVQVGERQFLLLDVEQTSAGESVTVEVLWQVVGKPTRDFTAFVHLLDEQGEVIAQADALLLDDGGVPSSGWPEGYLVRQQYTTSSPVPPFALRLGLYDHDTLQRLPVSSGGDSVTLPAR